MNRSHGNFAGGIQTVKVLYGARQLDARDPAPALKHPPVWPQADQPNSCAGSDSNDMRPYFPEKPVEAFGIRRVAELCHSDKVGSLGARLVSQNSFDVGGSRPEKYKVHRGVLAQAQTGLGPVRQY